MSSPLHPRSTDRRASVIPRVLSTSAAAIKSAHGLLLAARGQEVGGALTECLRDSMPEALLDPEVVVIGQGGGGQDH